MSESITITDNRTGESFEIPIQDGGVDSGQWKQNLPGLWFNDPGFTTTSSCLSSITDIKGDEGILRYRGYPIEQLAKDSTYLEVAYLLLKGELPDASQYEQWQHDITTHTYTHENFRRRFVDCFQFNAHPMGMLMASIAALGTFYPEAKDIEDPTNRMLQTTRLIAKLPTLAAAGYRSSIGMPYVYPENDLDYATNFLSMMFKVAEPKYECDPAITKALDVLFILHADHEQNCSTTTARTVGSAHADPYSAVSAAAGALYGPRHGGANEAVLNMLDEIGSYDQVDDFIAGVKRGDRRLMGFGHRVYKNFDPRATIIKEAADAVFKVTGANPKLDIALKLEEAALNDEYFKSRKLYPNVDFYSGLIYQALGFPPEMFTVLFTIPRVTGWLAHYNEMMEQDSRITRPRQLYVGSDVRDYVPMASR